MQTFKNIAVQHLQHSIDLNEADFKEYTAKELMLFCVKNIKNTKADFKSRKGTQVQYSQNHNGWLFENVKSKKKWMTFDTSWSHQDRSVTIYLDVTDAKAKMIWEKYKYVDKVEQWPESTQWKRNPSLQINGAASNRLWEEISDSITGYSLSDFE